MPSRAKAAAYQATRFAALLLPLHLAACGGRVSRPVLATQPTDAQLDCAHLTAEKSVNAARAADLTGEQNNDVRNNLGMLVLSPLFLNFTGSEQTELAAFAARESTLNQLIAQKCPKPPAA